MVGDNLSAPNSDPSHLKWLGHSRCSISLPDTIQVLMVHEQKSILSKDSAKAGKPMLNKKV